MSMHGLKRTCCEHCVALEELLQHTCSEARRLDAQEAGDCIVQVCGKCGPKQ
jgi:RNase P subunit RPR2